MDVASTWPCETPRLILYETKDPIYEQSQWVILGVASTSRHWLGLNVIIFTYFGLFYYFWLYSDMYTDDKPYKGKWLNGPLLECNPICNVM